MENFCGCFWEKSRQKIVFLVFVNSAFQIYMPWVFCGFCWGLVFFFFPFLKTMCVTFSVAGSLMPLSLASERNSAAKMRPTKSVSASEHLIACYWGKKCIGSGTGVPTQLWSSQTHLFPVSYITGLTRSGGQHRAKVFELVPGSLWNWLHGDKESDRRATSILL